MDQIDEPDYPYPSRFARLKRGLIIGGIVLALLVGLRLWWGYEAQRRYNAYIAAAHARGEKVLLSDYLTAPSVPDERNAAVVLQEAAQQLTYTQDQIDWENAFVGPPLSANDQRLLAVLREQNASTLRMTRQARNMPRVDWIMNRAIPALDVVMPNLKDLRELCNFAKYVGLYEHSIKQDADALERAFDIDRIGRAATDQTPALVTLLVRIGISAVNADYLRSIAPQLRVGAGDGAAERDRVFQIIHMLLDESDFPPILAEAWRTERMFVLDVGAAYLKTLSPPGLDQTLEPMFLLDALRLAREYERFSTIALEESNYPAMVQRIPDPPNWKELATLHLPPRAVSAQLGFLRSMFQQTYFHISAERRATASILAIRLYQIDHGRLPRRLEELVPEYLPHVPADPFAADGRALAFHPDREPPIVYSVSTDGADDGGADMRGAGRWDTPDLVFHYGPVPREDQHEDSDQDVDGSS